MVFDVLLCFDTHVIFVSFFEPEVFKRLGEVGYTVPYCKTNCVGQPIFLVNMFQLFSNHVTGVRACYLPHYHTCSSAVETIAINPVDGNTYEASSSEGPAVRRRAHCPDFQQLVVYVCFALLELVFELGCDSLSALWDTTTAGHFPYKLLKNRRINIMDKQ